MMLKKWPSLPSLQETQYSSTSTLCAGSAGKSGEVRLTVKLVFLLEPVRYCSVHRKKLSLQSALENYISVSHKGLRPRANLFESRNKRVYDYRQFGNAIWQQISRRTTEVSASLHRKLLSLDRPHTPLEDLHSLAVSSLCAGRSRFTTRFILYKPQGGTQGTSYFWRLWRRGNTLSRDSNRPYFTSMTVGFFPARPWREKGLPLGFEQKSPVPSCVFILKTPAHSCCCLIGGNHTAFLKPAQKFTVAFSSSFNPTLTDPFIKTFPFSDCNPVFH